MPTSVSLPSDLHPLAAWHSLEADGFTLRYLTIEGPVASDTWLVFHGFGQKPTDWLEAGELLSQLGRVIVVELPAHGQSSVPKKDRPLTLAAWEHWLVALCRKERVHTCSLLGYSLGGKLALASLVILKGRVEQVVLCAAEGGSKSFWYELATGTVFGRRLLKRMVFKPKWLFTSLGLLAKIGLVNKSIARFARLQLDTRAKRRLVARSWLALRELPPTPDLLAEVLNEYNIPFRVVAGAHDRVVPLSRMTVLADYVPHSQINVLEVGHNHLPKAAVALLVKEELGE
jgi:pimeloyl-ACP methyl ester carboxylesterase